MCRSVHAWRKAFCQNTRIVPLKANRIIPPLHAQLSPAISSLFNGNVRAAELKGAGDPEQLYAAEAAFLKRAVAKRTREFAAGRVCARRALAEFGIHDFPLAMAPDRQPLWPQQTVGSITHTEGYCAAVVALREHIAAIGIDSESRNGVGAHLWRSICVPEEIKWLDTLPEQERVPAATLIFSAKEAFYKCQYPLVQQPLGFHDAQVEMRDWDARRGSFSIAATRAIAFAAHAVLPMSGQYLFHEEFVTAGLYLAA